jgi:serine incorporator 1/3
MLCVLCWLILMFAFTVTILLATFLGVGWLQHFLAKIFGTDDQLHGDESHTTTVHGDESQTTNTNGDESQTMNMHVTSPSSLYHTTSPSSLYYSPEQSPTNNTNHQPAPPPPPSPSSRHTIELQMSEVPNISTSGMNEEEGGDDYIREWESE